MTLGWKSFYIAYQCLSAVIQVDLGRVRSLSGVATQGYMPGMFVSSYRVNYSTDGYTWRSYKNRGDSRRKVWQRKAPFTLRLRNLETQVSLWKRIKCFPFTLLWRNLNTQQSLDLCWRKTWSRKSSFMCSVHTRTKTQSFSVDARNKAAFSYFTCAMRRLTNAGWNCQGHNLQGLGKVDREFESGKSGNSQRVRENWNYNTADKIPLKLKETFQVILVLKTFPLNEVGGFLYKEISVLNELVEKTGTRKC